MKSRGASGSSGKVRSPVVAASIVMESEPVVGPNGKHPSELHEFLFALQAMRAGDFSVRMAGDRDGVAGKIADTFNEIVAANQRIAEELERAGEIVGREGKTRHRVKLGLSSGAWSVLAQIKRFAFLLFRHRLRTLRDWASGFAVFRCSS